MQANRKKLLLHVCCGPCAAGAIKHLEQEFEPTLFFSNSNIFPEREYIKRLENAKKLAHILRLPLIDDYYDHNTWRRYIHGYEHSTEGGERCRLCFEFNLKRTAAYAVANHFDHLATTLTISPHKRSETIFEVGRQFKGFLPFNFKKQDGFKESIMFSKQHELYRQNYCGCEFSIRVNSKKTNSKPFSS